VRAKCVFNKLIPRDSSDVYSEDRWEPREEWRGSAEQLEVLLKNSEESRLTDAERKEISAANWLGRKLALCSHHYGDGVCRFEGKHAGKAWVLRPRAQDRLDKGGNGGKGA
jgi:hypothetical protein